MENAKRNTQTKISKIIPVLITLLLVFPVVSWAGQFKATRVIDGDSIRATGYDIEIEIRLVGIDAPERSRKKNEEGQPFSTKSTKYLTSLVLNKTVEIKGYGLDLNNRILGVVFANGTNVNLEMVKAGLAEVYRGQHPKLLNTKIYEDAEAEA